MGARRWLSAFAAFALVAAPARSEPVGRDVGTASDSVTFGPATVTLFRSPFQPTLVPELTLTLRPMFGIQPLLHARSELPFRAGAPFSSDFGFRFQEGRFRAGARFNLSRDARGMALDAFTYARYVAPTYDLGLTDDARIPLVSGAAPTHRLTASAGFEPSTAAPRLHASASVRDDGTAPHLAAAMFGRF